jgi:HIRAN domain
MRAVMVAPPIKERDDCFTVRVRGSQYPSNMGIERWQLYSLFAPGDPLKLVPEPDNPEDKFAIAVWGIDPIGQDVLLGYIPADFAASITQQELKRGVLPEAWVLKKHLSEHPGRELLIIQIDLHPDRPG